MRFFPWAVFFTDAGQNGIQTSMQSCFRPFGIVQRGAELKGAVAVQKPRKQICDFFQTVPVYSAGGDQPGQQCLVTAENFRCFIASMPMYGDNVFEKDGIRRDRTGDGEKTRCLCGKRGIFNRDGPAMGPQIIRQLERRASRRSASFFHALASPGRPRNGGGASGAYQPAEGRKALIQGRFRAQEGPLGPSRKSQQQTKRTGFAALEDSIADEAPEGKRAKRANRALNRAGINSRGQKQGFGGADRRAGRVTSR